MRVTKGNQTLNAAEDKTALRFKHLQPLDLYRYANGGEQKVYMKLTRLLCICIAGGRRAVFTAHPEQMVVQYADASLDIGSEEKYAFEEGEEPEVFGADTEGEDMLKYQAEDNYIGHPQDWL